MHINIQGHGIELTEPLKDYTNKKIGKLDEFFNNIIKAEVILDARNIKSDKRSQVAEVSLWAGGKKVIRASESGEDMYAAIDLVLAELERQLKKHKEKLIQKKRRQGKIFKEQTREYHPETEPEKGPQIVKRANFEIKNMTREEAKDELKLLGRDFLLFRNAENGAITLLQGRKFIDPSSLENKTAEEAAQALKKNRKKVLAFLNSQTSQFNVLYKRNSGNFGLIESAL